MSYNVTFKPSTYQQAVLDQVLNNTCNLLVNAKAGSGKTSTLVMISEALKSKGVKSLFLAFNKSIVEELKTKVNEDYCTVKTVHSLGYTLISSYLYRLYGKDNFEISLDTNYFRSIVKETFDEVCYDSFINSLKVASCASQKELSKLKYDVISELIKLCNFVRFYVIDYNNTNEVKFLGEDISDLLSESRLYGITNYPLLVRTVLNKILDKFKNPETEFNKRKIKLDFTDLLWLPTVIEMGCPFKLREISCVLIDESQDINKLEQKLISNLSKYNPNIRFIFVGDERQAIYGFAGADVNSIKNIKNYFNLQELPLNICYRCPEKVINLAKTIVPEIECNKNREDKGNIKVIAKENMINYLKPGDVIIARKNKELLEIFKDLAVSKQFPIKFFNKELVDQVFNNFTNIIEQIIFRFRISDRYYPYLLKHINENPKFIDAYTDTDKLKNNYWSSYKSDTHNTTLNLLVQGIQEYEYLSQFEDIGVLQTVINGFNYLDEEINEYLHIINSFIDLYDINCKKYNKNVNVLNKDIQDFLDYLKDFLNTYNNKNVPVLSSIHKMKGGESDNVFIYNYSMLPLKYSSNKDVLQQEENLKYVAITRAKKNLYICLSGSFKEDFECIEELKQLQVI